MLRNRNMKVIYEEIDARIPLCGGISKSQQLPSKGGLGQPSRIPKKALHGMFLDALKRVMLKGWP
jgi:hypothetical protein